MCVCVRACHIHNVHVCMCVCACEVRVARLTKRKLKMKIKCDTESADNDSTTVKFTAVKLRPKHEEQSHEVTWVVVDLSFTPGQLQLLYKATKSCIEL